MVCDYVSVRWNLDGEIAYCKCRLTNEDCYKSDKKVTCFNFQKEKLKKVGGLVKLLVHNVDEEVFDDGNVEKV